MKQEWAREEYIACCTRNERSGLAWFKTGIWKLRGTSKDEVAIHILLKCFEMRKWREQFLSRKCLMLNERIAYKKIINCTNIIELRNVGTYLYKIRYKWENKISNLSSELGRGE
jgi:hypothetical protein